MVFIEQLCYLVGMKVIPAPPVGQLQLVVTGRRVAQELLLDLAARLALHGALRVLDGGNLFNAYLVARTVRRHTHHLYPVLDRIRVARAFTCYQMTALLQETRRDTTPILVLDLLSTFYDESVTLNESQRLLGGCLRDLGHLCTTAPVVVSSQGPKSIQPERAVLLQELEAIADQVHRFGSPLPLPPPKLPL